MGMGSWLGVERSPHWEALEREFKKDNPECAACGTKEDVAVHHIRPFHVFPDDELVKSNLISLCRRHHFEIGHFEEWSSINPDVVADAGFWRGQLKSRPVTIEDIRKVFARDAAD